METEQMPWAVMPCTLPPRSMDVTTDTPVANLAQACLNCSESTKAAPPLIVLHALFFEEVESFPDGGYLLGLLIGDLELVCRRC